MANGKRPPRTVLRNYDNKFLECRFSRHNWELLGFFREEGNIVAASRCMRCKTIKEQPIAQDGTRAGPPVMHYRSGYLIPTGETGVVNSNADVRLEMIRRSRVYADAASVLPEDLL